MARYMRAFFGITLLAMTMFMMGTPTRSLAASSGTQVVMVTGCSLGTNMQFAMGGNTTVSLPCATSSAADVKAALSNLPGIGSGVSISGTPTVGSFMLTLSGTLPLALSGSMLSGGNAITVGGGGMPAGVAIGVPSMMIMGGAQPLPYGLTIMDVTAGSVTELNGIAGCRNGGLYTTTVNGSFVAYDSRLGAAGSSAFMAWYPGGIIPQPTPFIVSCA